MTKLHRTTVNLDDTSKLIATLLAENLAVSKSSLVRLLLKQAYEHQTKLTEFSNASTIQPTT